MDSRTLRGALLVVTLFVLAMFLIVLAVNGVFEQPSKSSVTQIGTGSNADYDPDNISDETGYIYGSNLDAWMYDDTFWDAEQIGGGKYRDEDSEVTEEEKTYGEDNSRKYKDRRFEDYNSGNL